jgi:hypothetical protein
MLEQKTLPKAGTLGIASTEIMQFLYRIGGINYQDVIEIAQEFNKYECGISTVQQMLILEEKDVKECLKYQPLGKRKLYAKVIFQAIKGFFFVVDLCVCVFVCFCVCGWMCVCRRPCE